MITDGGVGPPRSVHARGFLRCTYTSHALHALPGSSVGSSQETVAAAAATATAAATAVAAATALAAAAAAAAAAAVAAAEARA